jgi:hypothetical protein
MADDDDDDDEEADVCTNRYRLDSDLEPCQTTQGNNSRGSLALPFYLHAQRNDCVDSFWFSVSPPKRALYTDRGII